MNLSIKTCGSEVLLFSEFRNIVSIAYIWLECNFTLFYRLNYVIVYLPIGNLWSICLGVNILSLERLIFKIPEPSDFIENILLSKPLRRISLASKNFYKFSRTVSFSCFLSSFCGLVLFLKSLMLFNKFDWSSSASSKVMLPK